MFRTIIYNDSEASSYEAVEVTSITGHVQSFRSGDFVKDWFLSTKWIAENILDEEPLVHSSSVDHFIGFDGGNDLYESRYMFTSIVDGAETTILLTREDCDITQLIELFVPKDGTYWSWQRLKDYCYLQDTVYDQSSPPQNGERIMITWLPKNNSTEENVYIGSVGVVYDRQQAGCIGSGFSLKTDIPSWIVIADNRQYRYKKITSVKIHDHECF